MYLYTNLWIRVIVSILGFSKNFLSQLFSMDLLCVLFFFLHAHKHMCAMECTLSQNVLLPLLMVHFVTIKHYYYCITIIISAYKMLSKCEWWCVTLGTYLRQGAGIVAAGAPLWWLHPRTFLSPSWQIPSVHPVPSTRCSHTCTSSRVCSISRPSHLPVDTSRALFLSVQNKINISLC